MRNSFLTLSHLDIIYTEANVTRKREIIGSIYPEKLSFDGMTYQTARLNEAVRLIYQINNELGEIKNRKVYDLSHLSGRVVAIEQMSNSFIQDLKLLYNCCLFKIICIRSEIS